MDKETITHGCNLAITKLKRSIVYASNLPNKEAQEALKLALEKAQESVLSAISALNDFDDPYENQSIATFTVEKYF